MNKRYIFAPGPVNVPSEVLLASAAPTLHHRGEDFPPFQAAVHEKLKQVFCTSETVAVLSSSGTGAVESAMISTISPGEKVLVFNGGKFGERWCKVARAYGMGLVELKEEWGRPLTPERLAVEFAAHPDARAVVVTQTETSSATRSDIRALAALTRDSEAILIVDAVSSFLAEELRMDDWGVDVVCTGSQKALMMPPGMGLAAVSPRARARIATCKTPRFYLDLGAYLKGVEKGDPPFTPAVNLYYALGKALDLILAEGVEEVWARHAVLARAGRAALSALGLTLFSESPSCVVTMALLPEGVAWKQFRGALKGHGITIAGGQDHMEGKAFRVANLGYHDLFDVVTMVTGVELALAACGVPIPMGKGVGAALEVLRHYDPKVGWRGMTG